MSGQGAVLYGAGYDHFHDADDVDWLSEQQELCVKRAEGLGAAFGEVIVDVGQYDVEGHRPLLRQALERAEADDTAGSSSTTPEPSTTAGVPR